MYNGPQRLAIDETALNKRQHDCMTVRAAVKSTGGVSKISSAASLGDVGTFCD